MDPWGRLLSRPCPTIEFQAGERPCVQKAKWMVAWGANAKVYLRFPVGVLPLKHTHAHTHAPCTDESKCPHDVSLARGCRDSVLPS